MNDNPCVKCKYHRFFNVDAFSDDECYHPKIRTPHFDSIYGKEFSQVLCSDVRGKNKCCENGRYFEPKEKNFLMRWYQGLTG